MKKERKISQKEITENRLKAGVKISSTEAIRAFSEDRKLYNLNSIKNLIDLYATTYIDGDIMTWIKKNIK